MGPSVPMQRGRTENKKLDNKMIPGGSKRCAQSYHKKENQESCCGLPQNKGDVVQDGLASPYAPEMPSQSKRCVVTDASTREGASYQTDVSKQTDDDCVSPRQRPGMEIQGKPASGRGRQPSLMIHGLDDPTRIEIQWTGVSDDAISQEEQLRATCAIRKIFHELSSSRTTSKDPSAPSASLSTKAANSVGGGTYAEKVSGDREKFHDAYHAFTFVSDKGNKRMAEDQLSRASSFSEGEGEFANPFEVIETRQIRLDDDVAIRNYIKEVFLCIQQLAMKLILKEWIKEIEPKKQKNYPYKKDKRPIWWPANTRYVEPDHVKIEDRIEVGLGIVKHAQNNNKHGGKGLDVLESVVNRQVLVFENEPQEKRAFRQRLMANLFMIAKAQQSVQRGERDGTDYITMEVVKKFERPDKRQKRMEESKKGRRKEKFTGKVRRDSALAETNVKSEGLQSTLGYEMVRSQSTIQDWISPADPIEIGVDNICYSQQSLPSPPIVPSSGYPEPGHSSPACATSGSYSRPPAPAPSAPQEPSHHMLHYTPQYHTMTPVPSRYPSFDGSVVDTTSPPMTPYHDTTMTTGPMHIMYPTSSQPSAVSFGAPINVAQHGIHDSGMVPYRSHMPMQHASHAAAVYRAMTESEEAMWVATPTTAAPYLPSQPLPFGPAPCYG